MAAQGRALQEKKRLLYTTFPAPQRSEKICVFPVDKRCFLRYNNQVGSALPATCKKYGPLVKRLRQRPLTPLTSVRFRYGSPHIKRLHAVLYRCLFSSVG